MATKKKTTEEKTVDTTEAIKTTEDAKATEDAKTEQAKETAKTDEAPKEEKDPCEGIPDPCVYCGPSVRNVARQYTTFKGGLPQELKELVRKHPIARRLIIAPNRFAVTRQRLETPGTAEAIIYKKLKAEL